MIPDTRTWAGTRIGDLARIEASPRRRRSAAPILEALESRRLLSLYSGPSANLPVVSRGGAFLVQVSGGPGVVKTRPAAGGAVDLTAYGTTAATTITITQTKPRLHFANELLAIQDLVIRSGQLGSLEATPAELTGRMTPLTNSVNNLDIGALGPKAQVNIAGSVAEMSASSIILGPTGHVSIAEGINAAAPTPSQSGLLTLGSVTIGTLTLDGGRFGIGGDSTLPITIQGNLTASQDGLLSIGRDEDSSFTVNGSILLSSGGQILVGRNLDELTVVGNVIVSPNGSGIAINGALNSLTVDGYFQGQGGTANPSAIDLGVGLNLSGLTILGGISGQGGLINANIRAGGSVSGVAVAYGTYNSTIQANTSMTT
jgi:hypothetical protein